MSSAGVLYMGWVGGWVRTYQEVFQALVFLGEGLHETAELERFKGLFEAGVTS